MERISPPDPGRPSSPSGVREGSDHGGRDTEPYGRNQTYVRGHDLYNVFYGPYKKQETSLLRKYIDLAPKEDFQDILEAIEKIPFLRTESERKKDCRFFHKDQRQSFLTYYPGKFFVIYFHIIFWASERGT